MSAMISTVSLDKSKPIVVITDNAAARLSMEEFFSREGISVAWAANASTAVALIETLKPNVALVDLELRNESGYSVCRGLKRRSVDIAVYVLASVFRPLDRDAVWACGADGILSQPISAMEVLSVIRRSISQGVSNKPVLGSPLLAVSVGRISLWDTTVREGRIQNIDGREIPFTGSDGVVSETREYVRGQSVVFEVRNVGNQQRALKVTVVRCASVRVFLCHAKNDKAAVRRIYQQLVHVGADPWLDDEKLLPGQDWELEIAKAIRTSDLVAVCLTASSTSRTGYVQKEIRDALDVAEQQPEGSIFIIPVRLEDCKVPDRLSRWQWVDLFDSAGLFRLLQAISVVKPDTEEGQPEAEDYESRSDGLTTA